MQLTINGKITEVKAGVSLVELLKSYKLNPDITIVERNREILTRDKFDTITLTDGDVLELIRYMGGGQ